MNQQAKKLIQAAEILLAADKETRAKALADINVKCKKAGLKAFRDSGYSDTLGIMGAPRGSQKDPKGTVAMYQKAVGPKYKVYWIHNSVMLGYGSGLKVKFAK